MTDPFSSHEHAQRLGAKPMPLVFGEVAEMRRRRGSGWGRFWGIALATAILVAMLMGIAR
jgi:hypothetical protein